MIFFSFGCLFQWQFSYFFLHVTRFSVSTFCPRFSAEGGRIRGGDRTVWFTFSLHTKERMSLFWTHGPRQSLRHCHTHMARGDVVKLMLILSGRKRVRTHRRTVTEKHIRMQNYQNKTIFHARVLFFSGIFFSVSFSFSDAKTYCHRSSSTNDLLDVIYFVLQSEFSWYTSATSQQLFTDYFMALMFILIRKTFLLASSSQYMVFAGRVVMAV